MLNSNLRFLLVTAPGAVEIFQRATMRVFLVAPEDPETRLACAIILRVLGALRSRQPIEYICANPLACVGGAC